MKKLIILLAFACFAAIACGQDHINNYSTLKAKGILTLEKSGDTVMIVVKRYVTAVEFSNDTLIVMQPLIAAKKDALQAQRDRIIAIRSNLLELITDIQALP